LTILYLEILPQYCDEYHLEIYYLLIPSIRYFNFLPTKYILLSNNTQIFKRKRHTQHDKISISSIQTMRIINIEVVNIGSYKLHNFMFPLSRRIRISKNNRQIFPIVILLYFFLNKKLQIIPQILHKRCSRRNRVIFKVLIRFDITQITSIKFLKLLYIFSIISRSLKPSRSLVVHLCPRCHPIQS
jgi:hypothetical protein